MLFHYRFYNSKYKRAQAPHVIGHFAAGARLIGLTEKQLQKHMEKIRESNGDSTSPYAQPLYNLNPSSKKRAMIGSPRAMMGSPTLSMGMKTGKIVLKFNTEEMRRKSLEAKAANTAVSCFFCYV